jgi:hypothetical protein
VVDDDDDDDDVYYARSRRLKGTILYYIINSYNTDLNTQEPLQ